jgi:hypothetical protein
LVPRKCASELLNGIIKACSFLQNSNEYQKSFDVINKLFTDPKPKFLLKNPFKWIIDHQPIDLTSFTLNSSGIPSAPLQIRGSSAACITNQNIPKVGAIIAIAGDNHTYWLAQIEEVHKTSVTVKWLEQSSNGIWKLIDRYDLIAFKHIINTDVPVCMNGSLRPDIINLLLHQLADWHKKP